jgi:excisionase family DNA binding protein
MSEAIPKLLTVEEFAERVGASKHTVRGWIKTRRINVCLLSPRMLRIEEREVARMIASGLRPRLPQAGDSLRLSEQQEAPAAAVESETAPAAATAAPALESVTAVEPDSNGLELGERERQRLEELKRQAND